MTIRCIGCGRAIRVPDEKAQNPRLKVKCTCGTVFALAEAMSAAEDAAAAERTATPPESESPFVSHVSDPSPATTESIASPLEDLIDTPPAVPEPAPARRTRPPGGWRRCVNHHAALSQSVCPGCQIGYCPDCEQKTQGAVSCPACDGLCVPAQKYEGEQEQKRQRQRSMMEEIEVIVRYPLQDPLALALLAVFSGLFAFFARFGLVAAIIGTVVSQGALFAYCFYALSRVAAGDLKGFTPPLGDLWELVPPMKLGLGALLISAGPLLLIFFLSGIGVAGSFVSDASPEVLSSDVVHADSDEVDEVEEPRLGPGAMLIATLLLIPAILWKIVYTPVAFVVAALSRSLFSTLNPAIGFDTIKKMGPTYWQAMLIYTVLALGQWVLGFVLSWVPYLGGFVASFVDAYVYLAIGCTLGLAVFKKAPELGWE
ncbi:MAG: hypothetical protein ABW221_04390 [Vicinamibacteria bacterium]